MFRQFSRCFEFRRERNDTLRKADITKIVGT